MLETSFVPTPSKLERLRAQISAECTMGRRHDDDDSHVGLVAHLAEQLIRPRRSRHQVLVVVQCFANATALMVRDTDQHVDLDPNLRAALDADAAAWSTMLGVDGRTTLVQISRTPKTEERANRTDRPHLAAITPS